MNLQSTKPKQPSCNGSRAAIPHRNNSSNTNSVQHIRKINNCNISVDEASNKMNNIHINTNNNNNCHERDNNIEDDPQLLMIQSNSQDSATNIIAIHTDDDPPIHSYPSYDDDSSSCNSSSSDPNNKHSNNNNSDTDNNSTSSTKHRRQLRELKASSDDCWDINLSDDEIGDNSGNNLPLDWNSSLVRRQFMKQRREVVMELCEAGNSDKSGGEKKNQTINLAELCKIQYAHFVVLKMIKYCFRDDVCVKFIVKVSLILLLYYLLFRVLCDYVILI